MITALIGLPRSGKDTFCRQSKTFWISRDEVRRVLHGKRFDASREKDVQLIYSNAVKTLLKCNPNINLILNETNCSVKSIRTVIRDYQQEAKFIYFPTWPDECKKRAIQTDQANLIPIIDRMYLTLLEVAEYVDKRHVEDIYKYNLVMPNGLIIEQAIEKIRQEVMGKEKYAKYLKGD